MQPWSLPRPIKAEKLANMASSALEETMPPLDEQTFLPQ